MLIAFRSFSNVPRGTFGNIVQYKADSLDVNSFRKDAS